VGGGGLLSGDVLVAGGRSVAGRLVAGRALVAGGVVVAGGRLVAGGGASVGHMGAAVTGPAGSTGQPGAAIDAPGWPEPEDGDDGAAANAAPPDNAIEMPAAPATNCRSAPGSKRLDTVLAARPHRPGSQEAAIASNPMPNQQAASHRPAPTSCATARLVPSRLSQRCGATRPRPRLVQSGRALNRIHTSAQTAKGIRAVSFICVSFLRLPVFAFICWLTTAQQAVLGNWGKLPQTGL
jgi:hypothetical protein